MGSNPIDNRLRVMARLLREQDPRGVELLSKTLGSSTKTILKKRFHQCLNQLELDAAYNEALFRVWKYGRIVDEEKNLEGWFVRICINEANRLSKRSTKPQCHDFDQVAALPNAPQEDQSVEKRLLRLRLRAAIDQLPSLQKKILKADLSGRPETSASILAKRFGTSANSIRVSRSKAKQTLRSRLAQEFPTYALAS